VPRGPCSSARLHSVSAIPLSSPDRRSSRSIGDHGLRIQVRHARVLRAVRRRPLGAGGFSAGSGASITDPNGGSESACSSRAVVIERRPLWLALAALTSRAASSCQRWFRCSLTGSASSIFRAPESVRRVRPSSRWIGLARREDQGIPTNIGRGAGGSRRADRLGDLRFPRRRLDLGRGESLATPPMPAAGDLAGLKLRSPLSPDHYDYEHFITYLRLLDADREGADWNEVAHIVLHIDSTREPDRARRAWHSHFWGGFDPIRR
jgi:hypothetical protein